MMELIKVFETEVRKESKKANEREKQAGSPSYRSEQSQSAAFVWRRKRVVWPWNNVINSDEEQAGNKQITKKTMIGY